MSTCTSGSLQDFCQGAKLILQPSLRASFAMTVVNITYTPSNTSAPYAAPWEIDQACSTAGTPYNVHGSVALQAVASSYVTASQPTVIVIIGTVNYTPPALTVQPIVGESIAFTYTKYVSPRNTSLPCFTATGTSCPATGD